MAKTPKNLIDMKELYKSGKKNSFACRGYSTFKRTWINEKGEQIVDDVTIETKPFSNSSLIKEWVKLNPAPEPPVMKVLCDDNGKTPAELELSDKKRIEMQRLGKLTVKFIPNLADKDYLELKSKWDAEQLTIMLMDVFDMGDVFGADKTKEFEEWLNSQGLSAGQLNQIAEDVRQLDHFTSASE